MTIAILLIVLSLVILYFGADWLVKGSSSLATRFGVSALVVGLTVVALGTSTPELLVSINAALSGNPEISVGNVVGSNIFNIGLILGISALIFPLQVHRQIIRLDMPLLLVVTALFTVLFWDGQFSRIEGGLFLTTLIAYNIYMVRQARKDKSQPDTDVRIKVYKHWGTDLLLIAAGLGLLAAGSDLLVRNAVIVAKALNMSEAVIGLTIVAAGTSMPELATSIVAALKKNTDIAIGNIVGSNLYNLLCIMGISSLIKPIAAPQVNYIDNLVMLGFTLMLMPLMLTGKRLTRGEGCILVIGYAGYMLYLLGIF